MKRFTFLTIILMWTFAYLQASIVHTETFEYSKLSQELITIDGKESTQLSYDNLFNTTDIGSPSIPVKFLKFSVPWNATDIIVSYTVSGTQKIEILAPIETVIPATAGSNDIITVESPTEITYDKNAVLVSNGLLYGINRVIGLCVYPITLSANDDTKAAFASNVTVTISWSLGDMESLSGGKPIGSYRNYDGRDFADIEKIVVNPESVRENAAVLPVAHVTDQEDWEYIIIAPANLCEPLERLAAWRRTKGYGSQVFSLNYALNKGRELGGDIRSGINDDAGKLRAFINYADSMYGTKYVLLAGKYPDMPIRYLNDIPSDIYFTDLDQSWAKYIRGAIGPKDEINYDCEISVGRIPFSTKEEIDNYINKLLIYETNYFTDNSHYRESALLVRQYSGMMDWHRNNGTFGYYKDNTISEFRELYKYSLIDKTATANSPTGSEIISFMNSNPSGMQFFVGHGHPGAIAISNSYSYIDSSNKTIYMDYGICSLDSEDAEMVPETGNGLDCLTNYDYPSWCFSISCSIMPFDIYKHFNYKYNIGESYLLSRGGGIALFGNTRESSCRQGQIFNENFFKFLSDKVHDCSTFEEVHAGNLLIGTRALTDEREENFMHNLLGDPLAPIYSSPSIMSLGYGSINNKIHFNGNKEGYGTGLAIQPLNDQTYAYRTEFNHEIGDIIELQSNKIQTIYGINCLPVILPLTIEDFAFESYTKRYLITGDVICGTSKTQNGEKGSVTFEQGCDITIESLGNVTLGLGTKFKSGSKLTIIAKGDVSLGSMIIPSGCTLKIEANTIDYDGEDTNILTGAIVEFIERNPAKKTQHRSANVISQPKMVVKNRTWWYNIEKLDGTKCDLLTSDWHSEFGIQIGDEVEIDGTTWHEINVVKRGDGEYHFGQIIQDEYPICISYIREEDGNVYVLLDDDLLAAYPQIHKVMQHSRWAKYVSSDPKEILVYHFGKEGDKFEMGAGTDAAACQITSVYNGTNMFEDWNIENPFVANSVKLAETGFMNDYTDLTVIEGIGAYSSDKEHMSLFFAPMTDNAAESEFTIPMLRFVTDLVNNYRDSVIFQAAGGHRQWDEMVSSPDIESTTVDEPARWYGVDGVEVAAPQAPGIYVKVVGTTATKVVVK